MKNNATKCKIRMMQKNARLKWCNEMQRHKGMQWNNNAFQMGMKISKNAFRWAQRHVMKPWCISIGIKMNYWLMMQRYGWLHGLQGMKVWAYGDETSMNTMEEKTERKHCQHDTWQPKIRSQTMSRKVETIKSFKHYKLCVFFHYVNCCSVIKCFFPPS